MGKAYITPHQSCAARKKKKLQHPSIHAFPCPSPSFAPLRVEPSKFRIFFPWGPGWAEAGFCACLCDEILIGDLPFALRSFFLHLHEGVLDLVIGRLDDVVTQLLHGMRLPSLRVRRSFVGLLRRGQNPLGGPSWRVLQVVFVVDFLGIADVVDVIIDVVFFVVLTKDLRSVGNEQLTKVASDKSLHLSPFFLFGKVLLDVELLRHADRRLRPSYEDGEPQQGPEGGDFAAATMQRHGGMYTRDIHTHAHTRTRAYTQAHTHTNTQAHTHTHADSEAIQSRWLE
mmetsp:Transcript_33017/g.71126  ORF Transcript_33017/g.71126 Transcript_33017/m.71126 type:complete len:284 (+) Transcript_33017:388-1239(+)